MFKFILQSIFSFFLISLFANSEEDPSPIANFEAFPSASVNGVNVITGAFQDFQEDIVVPSAEPIAIQRAYCTMSESKGTLEHHWNLNHGGKFNLKRERSSNSTFTSSFGASIIFHSSECPGDKHTVMGLSLKSMREGLTNCSEGRLSGRSNKKNYIADCDDKKRECTIKTGSGISWELKPSSDNKSGPYFLKKEIRPNGNTIRYKYDDHQRIKKIESLSRSNKNLSRVEFFYPNKKDFDADPRIYLKTSHDRLITYRFLRVKEHKKDPKYFLSQVERPEKPVETYTYDIDKNLTGERKAREVIVRKDLPDNRFLINEYYKNGSYKYKDKDFQVSRSGDLYRRIYKQKQPVGTDATPVITFAFKYDISKNSTTVLNANAHPTIYHYSDRSILNSIEHYSTPSTLYRAENFYWGKKDSKNEGNLLAKTVSRKGHSEHDSGIIKCNTYFYDDYGNVSHETLWGNLTGKNKGSVHLRKSDYWPETYGCEHVTIHYEYSDDGFNLPIKEKHPNGKVILYDYLKGTDLLISKFTLDGRKILYREFYNYNDQGVLIETIRDNGKYHDFIDQADVTERIVTKIVPKPDAPCEGLPIVITEEYHSNGKVAILKNIQNRYDKYGHLVEQQHIDEQGQLAYTLRWKYDKVGNIVKEKDALGNITEKSYDANRNLIQEKTANFTKQYTYDFSNRLIREDLVDSGEILTKTYSYDFLHNKVSSTDYYGNETRYEYDKQNRLIKVISPQVLDENGAFSHPTKSYAYDRLNNKKLEIDAKGNSIKKQFTIRGQPYRIEYPDQTTETFEYDLFGRVISKIDRNGLITTYKYDVLDRVTKETHSDNTGIVSSKTFTYDAFHLLSETDELGTLTNYHYDSGRLIEKICGKQRTTYKYDSLGNLTDTTQWDTYQTITKKKIFDVKKQLIEERIETNGQIHHRINYEYSPEGFQTAIINYNETGLSKTSKTYNARGLPTLIQDALGNTTVLTYNSIRNEFGQFVPQTLQTDSLGITTITQYDAIGRIVSLTKTDSLGVILQRTTTKYDLLNNPIAIDRDGQLHLIEYDIQNRKVHEIEAPGTPLEKHTRYTYNLQGLLETIYRPDGTLLRHTYDFFGRLLTFSDLNTINYRYHYNAKGWLLRIDNQFVNAPTLRDYDIYGNMIRETLETGLQISYEYDPLGRPIRVQLPDNSAISYTYEGLYLSKTRRFDKYQQEQYSHCYVARDLMGNPLAEKLPFGCEEYFHEYDKLGRSIADKSGQWSQTNLTYDSHDCLLSRDVQGTNCSYSYDKSDQIESETGLSNNQYAHDALYNRIRKNSEICHINALNQLTQQGEKTFTYDQSGNRISQQSETTTYYHYDTLNHLRGVQSEDKQIKYSYDPLNRLVKKTDGDREICYLYLNQNEIGSIENGQIQELRILGTGKGAEIGAMLAIEIQNEVYVPISDHNGNVQCILDRQGLVVESYVYSAFGEEDNPNYLNPWRYASKRYDADLGFINFGRRFYDPNTGRWLTPDPLGFLDGPNLYAYLHNNPLSFVDPFGLATEPISNKINDAVDDRIQRPCTLEGNVVRTNSPNVPNVIYCDSYENIQPWYDRSRVFNLGLTNRPNIGIGFINGMWNSFKDVWNSAAYISNLGGGINVNAVYNATHGLMDPIECLMGLNYIATEPVHQLHKMWNSFFDQSSPNALFLMICHSQGAIHVRNALLDYYPELRERIIVVAIAPAAYIYENTCAQVFHYRVSPWRDVVPRLDVLGGFRSSDSVATLQSHPNASFMDHEFNSPTYERPLLYRINNYINKVGK